MPIKTILWLAVMALLGIGIYYPGMTIQYYADDFLFVVDVPASKVFYYFLHNHPANWYRPIEASILAIFQSRFGLETWPIHLTGLFIHVLLSWSVFVFMIKLRYSRTSAFLGSLFMLLSQANVLAVLSNDTLSQLSSTLFGFLSVGFLYIYFDTPNEARLNNATPKTAFYRYYLLSLMTFILSLYSKESGVSFFPLLTVVLIYSNLITNDPKTAIKNAFVQALPYFVFALFYIISRILIVEAQPGFGSARYDFHLGMNVIKNLALFLFAASIPVSSVTAFVTFATGELSGLVAITVLALGFFATVIWGLTCYKSHQTINLLGILSILALFPMALMNHVSELYLYNSMPFIAILAGAALGKLLEIAQISRWKQAFGIVLMGILFAAHIKAILTKTHLMKQNGERAVSLLNQIQPFAQKVPLGGQLLLLNPNDNQVEYSVFLMKGFNVLKFGLFRINQMANRNDLTIQIIEASDLKRLRTENDAVVLSLYNGGLQVQESNEQKLDIGIKSLRSVNF